MKFNIPLLILIGLIAYLAPAVYAKEKKEKKVYVGTTSWYGGGEPLNKYTASGEIFDPNALTAAMPDRAMLGKQVKVTSFKTGRSLILRVNDIGPAKRLGRAIDLTKRAFYILSDGNLEWGLMQVKIEIL